jgi:hypothetical protein
MLLQKECGLIPANPGDEIKWGLHLIRRQEFYTETGGLNMARNGCTRSNGGESQELLDADALYPPVI